MIDIICVENSIKQDYSHFSAFILQPLETGQAITLGNAIRRTLISDLYGYGISGVRINDVTNKFSKISFCREDVMEILFNLKEIIFKESFLLKEKTKHIENFKIPGYLYNKGPLIITAGMLMLPKNTLGILNTNQYICTLVDNIDFNCEVDIQKQKNFQQLDEISSNNTNLKFISNQPNTLYVDGNYSPIKRVNFKTSLIYDINGNLKESLRFEILTRGNLSPARCFQEACKSLIDLLYTVMINNNFIKSTSELSKLFDKFTNLDINNNLLI